MIEETTEGYDKLKSTGYFDKVDKSVYELIKTQPGPVDCSDIFEQMSGVKYNLVQQAFTRLAKSGKIFKQGTHKGKSGFTRGVYSCDPITPEKQEELFL